MDMNAMLDASRDKIHRLEKEIEALEEENARLKKKVYSYTGI
jgi:cell division septum initiation protein DivIVA